VAQITCISPVESITLLYSTKKHPAMRSSTVVQFHSTNTKNYHRFFTCYMDTMDSGGLDPQLATLLREVFLYLSSRTF